jgi:DNA-binding response OmpR family regulator
MITLPPRILVIDDEQSVLDLLAYNLKKAHYTVLTAANGRQALEVVRQAEPDLILLDLMPEVDGLDVCREIRRTSKCRLSCSRRAAKWIVVGLELGADDYVQAVQRARIDGASKPSCAGRSRMKRNRAHVIGPGRLPG